MRSNNRPNPNPRSVVAIAASTVFLFVVLLFALGFPGTRACSRDDQNRQTTAITSGSSLVGEAGLTAARLVVSNEDAIARLVSARCSHRFECMHPDPDRLPSAEEAKICQDEVRRDLIESLDPKMCALGIDRMQLDECLHEIGTASCEDPRDVFSRYTECRNVELCPRVAE